MNVATLEDNTGRPIWKELRIRNRIAKPRLDATEIFPILCEFTVYEERRSIIMRDHNAKSKMQHLAAQVIVSETGPFVRPAIRWTRECSKLFAAGVAVVGEKDVVKLWAGGSMEATYRWYDKDVHLSRKSWGCIALRVSTGWQKKKEARTAYPLRGSHGHMLWHGRLILRKTLARSDADKKHGFRHEFPPWANCLKMP